MADLALFNIASERNRWLAAKTAVLSRNIANADTPGFKAKDIASFEAALQLATVRPTLTHSAHLLPDGESAKSYDLVARPGDKQNLSGNSVNLETELMEIGQVRSQHSMVTGIVSAFHRMLLQASRG